MDNYFYLFEEFLQPREMRVVREVCTAWHQRSTLLYVKWLRTASIDQIRAVGICHRVWTVRAVAEKVAKGESLDGLTTWMLAPETVRALIHRFNMWPGDTCQVLRILSGLPWYLVTSELVCTVMERLEAVEQLEEPDPFMLAALWTCLQQLPWEYTKDLEGCHTAFGTTFRAIKF